MKRKILNIFVVAGLFFALITSININFNEIYSLPDNFFATQSEISNANKCKKFGSIVDASLTNKTTNVSGIRETRSVVVFKLFGFIPIRKVQVSATNEEEVFVGGNQIGISLSSKGVIFIQDNFVLTNKGEEKTEKSEKFLKGDLITEINNEEISSINEVKEVLQKQDDENIKISFIRDNQKKNAMIKGIYDVENNLKLGLLVKDDVSGVGTLTFVKKDNSFGALGHAITEENNIIPIVSGKVFDCNLINIDKGEKNSPGQLRCVFMQNSGNKGTIQENTQSGIFGNLNEDSALIDENMVYEIGGRLSVNAGKAKIISSVSGIREEYDIEIIKATNQKKSHDKSLVIRVTDKRLLSMTGGIVQGMSGSPIIQNNKIIGAVTHVFVNDPTKGYGIYLDWMI